MKLEEKKVIVSSPASLACALIDSGAFWPVVPTVCIALVKLPLAALCNTRLQDAKLSDTCLKVAEFWGHGRGSQ